MQKSYPAEAPNENPMHHNIRGQDCLHLQYEWGGPYSNLSDYMRILMAKFLGSENC